MKTILKFGLLAMAGLAMAILPARAQLGVSVFDETRALNVQTPEQLPVGPSSGDFTNGPVDTVAYLGRVEVLINVLTNGSTGSSGVITCQPYTSADTTNWYAVTNFAAVLSPQSIVYTNAYWGINTNGTGGIIVTNSYLLPFTATTPNASQQLFNTPYPVYSLFTNAAPVDLNQSGSTLIAWPVNSGPGGRYFELVCNGSGKATNGACFYSAQLIGVSKDSQ